MSRDKRSQLLDILLQKVDKISDEVLIDEKEISSKRIANLENHLQLIEIITKVSPSSRQKWPLVIIFTGTLILISILLFARVSETEIELDINVSEASFTLASAQLLMESANFKELGITGISKIKFSQALRRKFSKSKIIGTTTSVLRVASTLQGVDHGSISLAGFMLQEQAQIRIQRNKVDNQNSLFILGLKNPLRVYVKGHVRMENSTTVSEYLNFHTPTTIILGQKETETEMGLLFPHPQNLLFNSQLPINNLSLLRIDEFSNPNFSSVRSISTILSGSIYYESLNGKSFEIRSGSKLNFGNIKGTIRTLQFTNDAITIKFHGYVHGMYIGTGEHKYNLMPTYLEWLQARHGLSLLWWTTIYVFGLLLSLLRWWEIKI